VLVKNCIMKQLFPLGEERSRIFFSLQGGLVLEVVVAKYWANFGEVTLDYSIAFHGVKPESPSVTMQGADGILSVELRSGLRSEEIAPVITLKNTVQVLRLVMSEYFLWTVFIVGLIKSAYNRIYIWFCNCLHVEEGVLFCGAH